MARCSPRDLLVGNKVGRCACYGSFVIYNKYTAFVTVLVHVQKVECDMHEKKLLFLQQRGEKWYARTSDINGHRRGLGYGGKRGTEGTEGTEGPRATDSRESGPTGGGTGSRRSPERPTGGTGEHRLPVLHFWRALWCTCRHVDHVRAAQQKATSRTAHIDPPGPCFSIKTVNADIIFLRS